MGGGAGSFAIAMPNIARTSKAPASARSVFILASPPSILALARIFHQTGHASMKFPLISPSRLRSPVQFQPLACAVFGGRFASWLGLALLANSPCYWLRRLHPIQDANRLAKFPRPGETSGLVEPLRRSARPAPAR